MSVGLSHDAETPVSAELVDWAELIFVMERVHKTKLSASLGRLLPGKRIVCFGTPAPTASWIPRWSGC